MAERYPEAELVLDDELLYDEAPRRSTLLRREERADDIVREGEVLAGKYRVERIPGRNGLGVLVQVRHMELGQEVTLKFLVPEACAYPEFVQRFVREARAAVRIQGEHVARVTDVGRLESGAPYMVREFLRGPDLAEVLKVRGPLPVAEAVDYILQACEGVAEGHALGVVHRNLRPTSLVVVRRSDGTALVKVFDFAASESLHVNPFTERAVSLVGTSAIMASLPYLAPEQIRDPHDVDFRADVYSLGAVLHELLTGTAVYAADAAPALLAQVAADAAPAVRTLRSDVPGELDHIVLRCLAKNRAIRYASIADLALALRPFASDETASSVDRIVRLGKRTSKVPELGEGRIPSPLPPAPSVPASQPAPARGRHGTLLMQPEPQASQSVAPRSPIHEDVTTINPYAAYSAPVVIEPLRSEPWREQIRTEPLPPVRHEAPRHEAPRSEVPRTEPLPLRTESHRSSMPLRSDTARSEQARLTPQPPPLRPSVPPPLRSATPPPLAPTPAPPMMVSERPELRPEPTSVPPPRSSMSGLTRSWAVPDEPTTPFFTQRRLVAMGAIAACATLGAVLAMRGPRVQGAPVAAAAVAAPVQAPAKVEPAPAAAPVAAPVDAAVAAAAPVASIAPAPAAVAPAATPAAVAPVASPAAVAAAAARPVTPAAVAAPAAAPRPAAVAPVAAAPVARRPSAKPRDDAPADASHKTIAAADQKVASARPAAGAGLFDDQR